MELMLLTVRVQNSPDFHNQGLSLSLTQGTIYILALLTVSQHMRTENNKLQAVVSHINRSKKAAIMATFIMGHGGEKRTT